ARTPRTPLAGRADGQRPRTRRLPAFNARSRAAHERRARYVARSDAEYTPGDVDAPPWLNALSAGIAEIDAAMPGSFGVYVRRLGSDPGSLDMGQERAWYLSSTIKVPVAIAILEQVDAGELSLDEEIELRQEDFVD